MKIVSILLLLFFGNTNITSDVSTTLPQKCYQKQILEVEGNSMSPMIQDGETIVFVNKYYRCSKNSPKIGDLISYKYGGNKHPLIKKIVATPKDRVEIKNNKLFINNIEVKNSREKPYVFSTQEIDMLQLYISENNTIPPNSYFILGDNTENSLDSRKFGAISLDDFLGKFER